MLTYSIKSYYCLNCADEHIEAYIIWRLSFILNLMFMLILSPWVQVLFVVVVEDKGDPGVS